MNWYYAKEGQSVGPITDPELATLVENGTIRDDTLVWAEGMAGWQPYSTVRPQSAPPPAATPAPPADNASAAEPLAAIAAVRCVECGRDFVVEETVEINGRRVCAQCKPAHLRRLAEGGSAAGGAAQPGAHGTATAEEILSRDYTVDAGARISEAWNLLFKEPGVMLLGGVLVAMVIFAIQAVPYIGPLVALVLTGPLMGGLVLFYVRRIRGETVQVGDGFSGFGPRFGQLFLVHLMPALATGVIYVPIFVLAFGFGISGGMSGGTSAGMIAAMVIPGILLLLAGIGVAIWLNVSWIYALALVADKGYAFSAALGLSFRVVKRHFWQNFWLMFLSGMVVMLGVLALCLGILVAYPLTVAALAIQYDRIFRDLAPANK